MPPCRSTSALPLARGWRKITRAGVLHAISVAATGVLVGWQALPVVRGDFETIDADGIFLIDACGGRMRSP